MPGAPSFRRITLSPPVMPASTFLQQWRSPWQPLRAARRCLATDSATATITGSAGVTVSPTGISKLQVIAPANVTAGVAFNVTAIAEDSFGNTVPTYLGTVHFTKSDTVTGTAVPADYTFLAADNGVHVFTGGATLITAATQTLTATDTATATITGSDAVTAGMRPPRPHSH